MADTLDIAKTKADIEKVKDKIGKEESKFEASIASLRGEQSDLEKAYARYLQAELRALNGSVPASSGKAPRGKVDTEAIIAVLRKSGMIELSATEIKERAGITATSNALSVALKKLVEDGTVAKIGERRNTKYKIGSANL
jgi:hypothetical protein